MGHTDRRRRARNSIDSFPRVLQYPTVPYSTLGNLLSKMGIRLQTPFCHGLRSLDRRTESRGKLQYPMESSSAPSSPTKTDCEESWEIQGLKMDLEKEKKVVQDLKKQLNNAELKNSIISQKMDIVECEKVEIYNDLVRNENEMKCQDMEIDQLEAGIRMAEKLLVEQKEQLEELRGTQKKEKPWNYNMSWGVIHEEMKQVFRICTIRDLKGYRKNANN